MSTSKLVQISHDGFAREYILREILHTHNLCRNSCDWCGEYKKGRLFVYYVEPEGLQSRPNRIKGMFCSIGCMRSYHNQEG